jgi:opacity protein-like surface antigen
MLLSVSIVALTATVYAEDAIEQFSLGGGKLTMAPDDAKAPDPGIVTARYGFRVAKDFLPYFGTGVAYSYQPDAKSGDITHLKTGLAAQFGFHVNLGSNSTLKLDYKYLAITPDLPRGDTRTPPQSFGLGIDIRF